MEKFDKSLNETGEVGFVEAIVQSIVQIRGLPGVRLGEMVVFETGEEGQVTGLKQDTVEVLLYGRDGLKVGTKVARTGLLLTIEVGEQMLGRTLNVLGRVMGSKGEDLGGERRSVDVVPLGISKRKKIGRSMETGVILVDLMVPLGLGQRELVIGDRKTGKSTFLLQTVMAQAALGNICVYAMIGKKKTDIKKVEEFFAKQGLTKNVVIVASSSHDSTGEIFLTPYTAMTIAEYFRDKGQDVLLVLDDMTTHAKFYRELALLGRRFPGRDSYPGDIFYVHSKLLERGGNYVVGEKEVSITCLPVADTVQGDISGYIQTNLMSMTDGHIYFDSELFFKGRRPAINSFISVTRVGRQTQSGLRQEVGREILSLLINYEKTQSFLKFGAELGESSRQILAMGNKILKFFDQPQYSVVPVNLQLALWGLLWLGLWDGTNTTKFVEKYKTDANMKLRVDEMIKNSNDIKKLLENVRSRVNDF